MGQVEGELLKRETKKTSALDPKKSWPFLE